MSLTKFPNGVSSYGLPVVGGALVSTGKAFFVHSHTGSNSYDGRDKDHPFGDLDHAIGQCTSGRNDIIYLMPGHTETLATTRAITADISGVSIVGIGRGSDRPQFTLSTTAGCGIWVSAHSVTLANILIQGGSTAPSHPIYVCGNNCSLVDIEFRPGSTNAHVVVADSCADNLLVDGLKYYSTVVNCDVISVDGANSWEIRNCFLMSRIMSSTTDGVIKLMTTNNVAMESFYIHDNVVGAFGASTEARPIHIGDTTGGGTSQAGIIANNRFFVSQDGEDGIGPSDVDTDYGKVAFFRNFVANNAKEEGWWYGTSCTTA